MDTNVKGQSEETIERMQSTAHETVDKVAEATKQAAGKLNEKSEQFKNAEQKFMEDCRHYVNEKPMTALALAIGTGFLLSRLMTN